jgi:excisionase family DNA binding protein
MGIAEQPSVTTKTAERAALLTQGEVSVILGISRRSFKRLIAAGSLDPVRIAGLGLPRYRRSDVERLIQGGRAP